MIRLIFVFLMSFFPFFGICQKYDISDESKQLYKQANSFVIKRNYKEAVSVLKKAIYSDPYFLKAITFLADIYNDKLRDLENAIEYYEQAVGLDDNAYLRYRLANCLFLMGRYEQAKQNYNEYLKKANYTKSIKKVKNKIKKCDFAIEAIKNPVPFDPVSIDEINSPFPEYNPVLSNDGNYIIFTRMIKKKLGRDEDLLISFRYDDGWSQPKPLSNFFNFPNYSEGAHTICCNDQQMYFTACNRRDSKGSCDIYYAENQGDGWKKTINLSAINSVNWDSQPSISKDGKTIFFSSDRAGSIGGKDIWMSKKINGVWMKPINIKSLNTEYDELCPFISTDGNTLYFSSDGHLGMGQLDFFISRRDPMDNWANPVNLGYPINSPKNEYGMFVSKDGKTAYFASDNIKESGNDIDIYSFVLPQDISPKSLVDININILDKQGNYLEGKDILIYITDKITGKKLEYMIDEPKYTIQLDLPKQYAIQVYSKGYMMYSDNINTKTNDTEYNKNIYLEEIIKDKSFVLNNILFRKNEYEITPNSYYELDILVRFLKLNPSIGIEIGGHTDDTGEEYFNWQLSNKRARIVYQYLIKKGVNKDRLWFKGYGYSKPFSLGKDESSRSKNRRTEVKIIKTKVD